MNSSDQKSLMRHACWILILISMCYSTASFFRTVPGTIGVALMQDFEVGGGLLAVMSSAYFYPYALMQIPAGIVADRWGTRKTLTIVLLIASAGSLLFALSTTVWFATLGRVLIGAGMGMMFVPSLKGVLSWFPPHQRVLSTGLMISFGSMGMVLATYPLSVLTQWLGWRESMLIATGITGFLGLTAWFFVQNKPQDAGYTPIWQVPASTAPPVSVKESMIRVCSSRTYWIISFSFFCIYGSFYSIAGLWAGPYLMQGYGLELNTAGVALLCLALGSAIGPSILGGVATWCSFSKRTLLIAVNACIVIMSVPFVIPFPVVPLWLIPLWMAFLGVFCSSVATISFTKVQEDVAPEISGTATGMVNIFAYIGATLLQLVSGWLIERQGVVHSAYSLSHYASMFILFFTVFCVSLIVLFFCPNSVPPSQENTTV